MDNNKKFQINKIQYENLNTVGKVYPVNVDSNINNEFSKFMKNVKPDKKKKKKDEEFLNDDIVVSDTLKELISEDNEVKKTIEKKIASSKAISNLLSKEKITPNKEEEIIK